MSQHDDLAPLLAAIRGGDPSGMQVLYDRYAAGLYRYCLVRLGEAEAAQEVVQDVFLRAWQALGTFDYRGEAALVAWLYTIARHGVISYLRTRKPQVSLEATGAWAQPQGADVASQVCEREALRQALRELSVVQQQVIALHFFAGLTLGETAVVLARTEGAIKAQQYRALLRLHERLSEETAMATPQRRSRRPVSGA